MKKFYKRPLTLSLEVDMESLLLADSSAVTPSTTTTGINSKMLDSSTGDNVLLKGNAPGDALTGKSINDAW